MRAAIEMELKSERKEKKDAKGNKSKKGGLNVSFHFIIMAYLLTIGSRGRHKALCRPKNSGKFIYLGR